MATFEKHYIGKGTQVENYDIVKVVIPVEFIEEAIFENKKDGKRYLSFEIAKMKNPDKFDRTHTCYYQTKVQSEQPADKVPEKQKKADKKKKKKSEPAEDDLPF
ncbi:MAG: hypothetical protein JZU47_10065 [Prolixibacteraceae bacterium]|nr:hypothetical protein [Prolixibacteraceae bacterium]